MALFQLPCGINADLVRKKRCSPPAEGTKDIAQLINYFDILKYTFDANFDGGDLKIITGIKLKFTKRAYRLEGRNNSIAPQNNFDGAGIGKYLHLLDFTVFDDEPETANALKEFNAGKSIGIVETNNEWFKVLGRTGGLSSLSGNQEVISPDTGGGYRVSSQATAKSYADYLAVYTSSPRAYNYEASKALFESLIIPSYFDIANIIVGATTTIVLDDTVDKPFVQDAKVGTLVFFKDIVGTVGSDAVNGLNNKSIAISEIIDEKTFKIATNTTALVYTSGGDVR
jgi:hypothetical protein